MLSPIRIVVCTDKNYLPGAFVTLGSLLDSNGGKDEFILHVLDTGIGNAGRGDLEKFIAEFPNAQLRFHTIDASSFKDFPPGVGGNFSTYARLLIGSLVDSPRCVYIDTDFLVLKDVANLWRMETGDKILWAIRNYRSTTGIPDSLDYDCPFLPPEEAAKFPYYCMGIFLCDLDKWRQLGIEEKAFDTAIRFEGKLRLFDQTIFNYLLRGQIGELEREWSHFTDHAPLSAENNYHYINYKKPWGRKDFYAANFLWREYYRIRIQPYFRFKKPWKIRLFNIAWELRTFFFALCFTEKYIDFLRKKGKPKVITDATRNTLNEYRRWLLHGPDPQSRTTLLNLKNFWKSR